MLIADLSESTLLPALPGRFQRAIDFLRTADCAALPDGRHDIDGDAVFALVQEYTTRPLAECRWESHRRYSDVQFIVRGVERMGVLDLAHARVREPYDEARDVAFYQPGTDAVTLHAGMLAIFGPADVHAPGGAAQTPDTVKKVVVKVMNGATS
jgi:YhcH/YjgK/YiaL family protein